MGLLGIFLFVLTDILVQTLDVRTESTAATYVASDGEYLRYRLQYDIRRATAITDPASAGSSGSQLQLTIGGSTATYSISNGNLLSTQGGSAIQLNTSSTAVQNFSVLRIGNGTGKDTIRINYTVESRAQLQGQPAESFPYSLTIGTR